MIEKYKFDRHINNIKILEEIINGLNSKHVQYEAINILADYIQNNQIYSYMQSYSILLNIVVEIIEYCNSNNFSNQEFKNKNSKLIVKTINFLNEINSKYKVNLYFKGKDKYNLVDKIAKLNVDLKRNEEMIKNENIFNILVYSEETYDEKIKSCSYDKVIKYDKFMNDNFDMVQKLYNNNYDYNYLINSIDKAKETDTKGIIVGASYPLHGIDENEIDVNMVQLSLPSQDLYYSFKIAKEIIQNNTNINKCYIGTAYWSLYSDISKCPNDGYARIQNVYYPIFGDSHNYKYSNKLSTKILHEFVERELGYIFDIDLINSEFNKIVYKSYRTYFNRDRTREFCSMLGNEKMELINVEEKNQFARGRVDNHNKLRKYKDVFDENVAILRAFLRYLSSKNVKPIIVNFITTEYYNNFFDKGYILEYNNIIKELKDEFVFEFIDLNGFSIFKETDFVDIDHMSDEGALKVSKILNEMLERG